MFTILILYLYDICGNGDIISCRIRNILTPSRQYLVHFQIIVKHMSKRDVETIRQAVHDLYVVTCIGILICSICFYIQFDIIVRLVDGN